MMKVVYICSPLRGDMEKNIQNALDFCLMAAKAGCIPIAPHAYFTRFLDDRIPADRKLGLQMGLELMPRCNEMWVFGTPSERMRAEIKLAEKLKVPIQRHMVLGGKK